MTLKCLCEIVLLLTFLPFGQCKSPHIIFILADDLGWNDVGFHGSDQIPTPNIDALAYSGVILNNYYVQPICTPSRGALMSALHPIHTGLQHEVIVAAHPYGLPLNITLLPSHLNDLGYESRIVGKWHLGMFEKEYTPTYRGFHQHYGYWTGRIDYYDHTAYDSPQWWGYDFRRNMDVDRTAYGKYTTDLLTDEAVSIISSHNVSQPLFLYMAHLAVHTGNLYDPIQAPADVVDRFSYIEDINRRKFAGALTKLDESVGHVVEALAKYEMLEDSIIVFSTDNGGPAGGFNSNAASNWPLRGVKASMWEGGMRGAALVWSPLINSSRRVSNQMMQILDWMPTLIAAAGGDPESLPKNDGFNMWPSIINGESSPRTEILHNIDPIMGGAAIRIGEWKLVYKPSEYGPEWDGWFGPSGRNDTRADKHLNDENQIYNSETSTHFEYKRRNKKKKQTSRVYFENILNSKTGKAVKKMDSIAFRFMHKLRNDAEVLCDPIPENATASCMNSSHPCLFHIPSDPCEYNDLFDSNPERVNLMQTRLSQYEATAIPPGNTPKDPLANPVYWSYTWTNWKDFPQQVVPPSILKKTIRNLEQTPNHIWL